VALPNGHLVFYILLTVQLGVILVNNQLDAQFLFKYVYFISLHVSSNLVLIIRRVNCISTTSGICHSVYVTVRYACRAFPTCIPDCFNVNFNILLKQLYCASAGRQKTLIHQHSNILDKGPIK